MESNTESERVHESHTAQVRCRATSDRDKAQGQVHVNEWADGKSDILPEQRRLTKPKPLR